VLPDTSSLLNILEAPVPEEGVSPNVVPAAVTLLGRLRTAPPSLHMVLAQVVEEEWLLTYLQFSGLQIAQRLHVVAEEIIGRAMVIAGNDGFHSKAGMRIFAGDAPAMPGKKVTEANDCLLIEQYLELCRRLRAQGFVHRCVFITSNTHDFGEPKAPRPPLDREFSDAKIDFVYDLAAVGALI
jgi:hypothetical protein